MAILDRIKFDAPNDSILAWKHPSDKLHLGAQLIVHQTQEALFFKGGQALDLFGPGTHTLTSKNLPLLDKLVNLPFGGETPFAAEVWFINKIIKRDLKWGTKKPIQSIDPKFGYPVNVRGFGSWGIQINDSKVFLNKIVGTLHIVESDKIESYFEGEIVQKLSEALSKCFTEQNISIFNANSNLTSLSQFARDAVFAELDLYGVQLVNFNVERINIPDEDMKRFQVVLGKKMEIEQLSQTNMNQTYITSKSLDIMEKAAQNEGGAGGAMASGMGLGMGVGAGVPLGQQVGQALNIQMNSAQSHPNDPIAKLAKLKQMLDAGLITLEDYDQHKNRILGDL